MNIGYLLLNKILFKKLKQLFNCSTEVYITRAVERSLFIAQQSARSYKENKCKIVS